MTGDSPDWRAQTLARMRKLIEEADPEVTEDVKWRKPSNPAGVPVWEHAGLFNAGFGGNTRRAIDIREGGEIDEAAFKALVREAVVLNVSKKPTGG